MSKTILVIEDEPDVQIYLATLFQENGYEVVTASNGKEGEAALAQRRPDLICLDILMPEKSGIALYRELRKNPQLSGIPVVMVTGFRAEEFPGVDFKKFVYERSVPGPEGYVEKPIDRELLLRTVREILDRAGTSSGVSAQERGRRDETQENTGHRR
jgi:CheY-like chemotaxis protein